MIYIVYEEDIHELGCLGEGMFLDRAAQFRQRLGWDVHLDEKGHEKDEYDAQNPLYLILTDDQGMHLGSMRFLPTTERVMVNETFAAATGVEIRSPFIWECTRFCLSPCATVQDSTRILMGTLQIGLMFDLKYFVGVFENRMLRVYERIGWSVDESQRDSFKTRVDLLPNWKIQAIGSAFPVFETKPYIERIA